MNARRSRLFLFCLAGLAAALRAAPVTPADGIAAKGLLPSSAPPAAIPAANPPATTPTEAPAKNSPAAPAADNPTAPAATPAVAAPDAPKPGILTAVKAKGPPPASKASAAVAPLSPRFQQIRTKMAALFDARNSSPAPADPRTNPFRPPGAVPLAPLSSVDGAAPLPVTANNDLAALQQAVATLRVKGTVQRLAKTQLVITSAPGKEGTYKEGDVINVVLPAGDPVHVRVRVITAHSVTLTLNDAEMVLKF